MKYCHYKMNKNQNYEKYLIKEMTNELNKNIVFNTLGGELNSVSFMYK